MGFTLLINRHRPTVQNVDKNVFEYLMVVKYRKCDELSADFIHPPKSVTPAVSKSTLCNAKVCNRVSIYTKSE